jgi:hypothetical protein
MSREYDNSETVDDELIEFFSNKPEDLRTATNDDYDDGEFTKVTSKKKPPPTSTGGRSGRGRGGRDGRGGREGRGGRGYESFENKNPFKDSLPLPKPTLSAPKGKILHGILVREKSIPVTLDDFKVFTVREKSIGILYVASVRGKDTGFFKGTRTELANRWQFTSSEILLDLINNENALNNEVIKQECVKPNNSLNETSRLFKFEGVLGNDIIKQIHKSTTDDEKKDALLKGIYQILVINYGETIEVRDTYKSLEQMDIQTLLGYYNKPRAFASMLWKRQDPPRWNPITIPSANYLTMAFKSNDEKKAPPENPYWASKTPSKTPPTTGNEIERTLLASPTHSSRLTHQRSSPWMPLHQRSSSKKSSAYSLTNTVAPLTESSNI